MVRDGFTGASGSGDYEEMTCKRALAPSTALLLLTSLLSCGAGSSGADNPSQTGAAGEHVTASGGSAASAAGGRTSTEAGTAASASGAGSAGAPSGGNTHGGAASTSAGASQGGTTASGGATAGSNGGGQASGGAATTGGPITCRAKGDGKSTITLVNHCTATLSVRGSDIQGAELAPGEHVCRDVGNAVESIPAIRFWGFIGQDPGGERYTLAELTLNTDFNDFDWYNISHVDAHNLPMQLAAVDMDKCRTLTCAKSLLADCPAEGVLKDKDGKVISCFSPHKDDKNSVVARYFEAGCADAYSWSGDDQGSVVACAGEDYDVVFCP